VRQLVRTPQGWRERQVGLDGDRFVPVAGAMPMDAAVPPGFAYAPDGAILETSPAVGAYASELALRLADQPGALLIIDYGYAGIRLGSTLQAVRRHKQVDPFAAPAPPTLPRMSISKASRVSRMPMAWALPARSSRAAGSAGWASAPGPKRWCAPIRNRPAP